jgi:hypothetical protein
MNNSYDAEKLMRKYNCVACETFHAIHKKSPNFVCDLVRRHGTFQVRLRRWTNFYEGIIPNMAIEDTNHHHLRLVSEGGEVADLCEVT